MKDDALAEQLASLSVGGLRSSGSQQGKKNKRSAWAEEEEDLYPGGRARACTADFEDDADDGVVYRSLSVSALEGAEDGLAALKQDLLE